MKRFRDNGWAYALGLAVLSFPIVVFQVMRMMGDAQSRIFSVGLPLTAAVCGSFGALCSGVIAYETTARYGRRPLRAILLTTLTLGMAFAVASVPFFFLTLLFMGSGWLEAGAAAWMVSVNLMGLPAFGLTAVWSFVYLTKLGADRSHEPAPSSPGEIWPTMLWFAIGSAASILTLAFSISNAIK